MPCLRTICRCSILIVWASFVPLLVRVCFCLCCVHIIPSAGLICCVFCCFFVFFPPIIVNVNLLMLCLRTICRCSILIVWASFVLLLVRVCFCLCCGHIVPGLGLICCVFCFFFEFFLLIVNVNLLMLCLLTICRCLNLSSGRVLPCCLPAFVFA